MSITRSTVVSTEQDAGKTAETPSPRRRRGLSTDSWAVLLALGLAALVKLHILTAVKW